MLWYKIALLEGAVPASLSNHDAKFTPNIMQIFNKQHQKYAFAAPMQKISANQVP